MRRALKDVEGSVLLPPDSDTTKLNDHRQVLNHLWRQQILLPPTRATGRTIQAVAALWMSHHALDAYTYGRVLG